LTRAYQVDVLTDWRSFEPRWLACANLPGAVPFQNSLWIRTWLNAFAGPSVSPVLVTARETASGQDALLLPLVLSRRGQIRTLCFPDFFVTDCNAPGLGPGAPPDPEGIRHLWSDVLAALPPADILDLDKMPAELAGRANPLVLAGGAELSRYRQHMIRIPGGWDAYLAGLERGFRKELGRSLRMFEAAGSGARFRLAGDAGEGLAVLKAIHGFQIERLTERGASHVFGAEAYEQFYAELVTAGAGGGFVHLSALELDGRIVAGMLAISARPRVTFLRLGHAGGELARIGLGRLIIERTMKAFAGQGYTEFDFSIGEGEHKRRFRTEPMPLWSIRKQLSWRAAPVLAASRVRDLARGVPALRALADRLRRR